MKLSLGPLLAVAMLSLVGCADPNDGQDPADDPSEEPAEGDDGSDERASSSSSSSSSDEGAAQPDPTAPTDTETPSDETPPDTSTDPPPSDAPPATDDKGPDKTMSCTSSKDGQKSVSKMTYAVWTSGKITISKLAITVTNKDGRDKNDANVFVTLPGQSETKSFNTGDVLGSGSTVSVKLPADFEITEGAKVRIETNFDERFFDAAASCTLDL